MIIGKNNQQKIIGKNNQSNEEDKVGAVLYLWQVAKSFLRQVIRSTISTIEATTFVWRWNDSLVVFTLFLYIYLQNKICTESVALIHLQQNGDREEGNKKCPEKETIHNYAIYVWKYLFGGVVKY